jgi:hypothetical protein
MLVWWSIGDQKGLKDMKKDGNENRYFKIDLMNAIQSSALSFHQVWVA